MTQTHSTSVSSLSYFPNLITPNLSLVFLTDVCFNWKKPILVSMPCIFPHLCLACFKPNLHIHLTASQVCFPTHLDKHAKKQFNRRH